MSAEPKQNEWQPQYTIAEWKEWEGQWELIEGQAWAMTPMPSFRHQQITGELFAAIREALGDCQHCKAYLPLNYRLSDQTLLHPDLLVVCGHHQEDVYLEDRPALVVEVLSPSTAFKDLNLKTLLYAGEGVPYYLLVNPDEEWVRVLVLREGKYVQEVQGREGSYRFELDGCVMELAFGGIWGR